MGDQGPRRFIEIDRLFRRLYFASERVLFVVVKSSAEKSSVVDNWNIKFDLFPRVVVITSTKARQAFYVYKQIS